MQVRICDEKGCGKVVEEQVEPAYSKETDKWAIKIELNDNLDRCQGCTRKLMNQAVLSAHDELKRRRAK